MLNGLTWPRVRLVAYSFSQSWWAVALIGLLVSGIVYQRWQYMQPRRPQLVKVGDRVPSVTLKTLDGQEIRIDWGSGGKATIVYAFTPACVWCKRNLEAMKTLADNAHGYRFIAVSLTAYGVEDYVSANNLRVPVYVAGQTAARQLGVSGTPSTIIIEPSGIVKKFWRGVYYGKVAQEVSQLFNVRLPEVRLE
jgi:peroxiredoxin